jgi:sugar lactone lactonase YvrE
MMLARTGKLRSGVTRILSVLFPPQTPTRRTTSTRQHEGLPMKIVSGLLAAIAEKCSPKNGQPAALRSYRQNILFLKFVCPGLLVLLTAPNLLASFSLTFQGLVQTVNTGGSISLSSPAGIILDPAGDVFIVDTGNNRIVEVNAQGTASVLTITGLTPSLSSPSGIALDSAGNLYIADTGNSRVVEVTPAGIGSVINTGSVTLSSPRGVALDQSGDIFIADTGNNRVVEVTSGGSAAALTIIVSTGTSTLSSPKGLAVSVAGQLYIADSGNNRVVRVAPGSTTGSVQTILGGVTLSNPSGVIVDRIGNVIIADTGNDRIAEVDTSSNGTVLYTDSVTLNGPLAMALDAFGTVYIADTGDSRGVVADPLVNADLAPGDETYSLNKSAVGFGHVSLGSANAVTLTLPFTTGQVGLGAVKVTTSGIQNLDFTAGPDTSCNSSTTASTSCSVEISFLPTAPGLRTGAVVLYDSSQNPILTIPLYGWGDSPVAALAPNTGSVINAGGLTLSNPYQVALDGMGNMYVGDYTGKNVTKIPAGGGSASVVALGTPGSIALQNITGVAVDGAGNLYIGDHQNSRILVMTPGGVVSVLSITGLSPALGFPTALALDGAGNLFVADFTNGRIVEISTIVVAGSTSSGLGTVINTGSYTFTGSTLTGLAIDSQGNIYAAARTQNNSSIIKITTAGVASALAIPGNITPAINNPQGVAVDAMGNIYIVDTAHSRIVEITNAGVASVLSVSGLSNPSTLSTLIFGTTVDPYGNLYISDWTDNRIVFVNVSGAVLSFVPTNQGSTSLDSPKAATVTNLGNQPLIFSANPTYTTNFSNNTSDGNPCTSSTSLLGGTACDVSVNFTPQAVGNLSAGITVTNNALNVSGSTQQVSVSGTGVQTANATALTLSVSPTSAAIGQPVTVTATVTDTATGHTSTVPTGSVNLSDTVGSTTVMLNGGGPITLVAGQAVLTGATLNGAGSHTIGANYSGVSGSFLSSSNTVLLTMSRDTAAVSGPATQPVQLAAGQAGSAAIMFAKPYSASPAPTGSITYTILNSSSTSVGSGSLQLTAGSTGSTATVPIPSSLPPGTYTVSVSYTGDGNYSASATPLTFQVKIGLVTPTATLVSSLNPALVTTAVTFTATVSSSGTPTGSVGFYDGTTLLGSVTLSQSTAAYTTSSLATGTHSITAVYGGDNTFASATSSALSQVVQDFSLAVGGSAAGSSNPPTQTVVPGGTATYTLALGPTTGITFPVPVTLSVSGVPPGATATVTPQVLPAGSPLTNVTLSVQLPTTTAFVPSREWPASGPSSPAMLSAMLCGILFLPLRGKLRLASGKRFRAAYLLALAIVGISLLGVAGCASKNTGYFGNPQTSYTLTVTATAGTVSHSTTVNLIVK